MASPDERGFTSLLRGIRIGALVGLAISGGWLLGENRVPPLGSPVAISAKSNGKIAFLGGPDAGRLEGTAAVYVADPDGTHPRRISPSGNLIAVAWSPDGKQIVYLDSAGEFGGGSISVMNPDGSDRRVVVNGLPTGAAFDGVGWSPDGRWLVYSEGTAKPWSGDNRYRIFVMPTDGGRPIQLTHGPEEDLLPTWSPDGTKIAFLALAQDLGSPSSIDVMQANGSDVRTIVRGATDVFGLSWSPDGQWIVFGESRSFLLVRPDGTEEHTIYTCPLTCGIGAPTWSPDGTKIALTISPGRIVTIAPDGTNVRDLGTLVPQGACCLEWQPVPR